MTSIRFIAKRYLFSREKRPFVRFIFWFSLIGMVLGCCALLVTLSIMNGFKDEIWQRYEAVLPDFTIVSEPQKISQIMQNLQQNFGVQTATVSLQLQGLLQNKSNVRIVTIHSLEPEDPKFSHLRPYRGDRDLRNFNIAMSTTLANILDVTIGSKLILQLPKVNYTLVGAKPRTKKVTVAGLFYTGSDLDSTLIFADKSNMELLWQSKANRIRVVESLNNFPNLQETLPNGSYIEPWYIDKQSLFAAMEMEKKVTGIMLLIVIFIASLNIASGLLLFITDKRRDIAILKTLGCSNSVIAKIFMSLGMMLSSIGILCGCILGYFIANFLVEIMHFFSAVFGLHFFDPNIFYISDIPSKWLWSDCIFVIFATFLLAILCNILPIRKAYNSSTIDALTR